MTRRILAQFWAPYRGNIGVEFVTVAPLTADQIARVMIKRAVMQFDRRWPFPAYDQKQMVCCGLTDGTRTVNAKDLPQ